MLSVNIKKRLGKFRLDVSFDAGNETIALLGASGCGKSMTLKCIAGIEKPDEGRIALDGRILFDSEMGINLSPQKRRVGYLFQQYSLFPNMTVAQNIMSGVRLRGREERLKAVSEKIAALQLTGLEDKRPNELSGGQQQRVALARILVNEPEVILLDEPFSALDDYLRWQLELELADTLKAFRGTTVFVSHSRDEVYRLCGSVSVLTEGRSEQRRAVRELFEAPETLSACLLSGCKNFSRIRKLDDTHVEATDWGTVLTVAKPIPETARFIGVRAHYITPADDTDVNVFHAVVDRVVENVFTNIVMLRTPAGKSGYSLLRMELGKRNWAKLHAPEKLQVRIRPEDIMLLKE
jgi:molybdate transport system ATP-binding protein